MSKTNKWAIAITAVLILGVIAFLSINSYNAKKAAEAEEQARLEEEARLRALHEEYLDFLEKNNVFFPGSNFNSVDISGKSIDEVITEYEMGILDRAVTVSFADGRDDKVISARDLGIKFDEFENYVEECFYCAELTEEEYYGTPARKDYSYDVYNDVSAGMLDRTGITEMINEGSVMSHNAYVYVDEKTGEIKEEAEVCGGDITSEDLAALLSEAFSENKESVEIGPEYYEKPEIVLGSKELEDQKALLESKKNKEITIFLCGEKTTLKEEELWRILSTKDGVVDRSALTQYVKKLKGKYDSYYFKRPFTTSSGKELNLEPGNYGWIIDAAGTENAIIAAIESEGDEAKAEATYRAKSARPAHNEIGNTYIEVSIHHQRIWVYVDGECVLNDDVTTGEITTGNPHTITNCGVFKLSYKTKNVTLRGSDYEEPVSYWMPFDGGIGFHDATWREDWEFGGENYMGNGSHGCINMRLGSAAILYDIIDYDIPIIVW